MAIRGVILDVDGTLLRSNDAHAYAWADAFAEAGIAAPYDIVRPLIGMGADKLLTAIQPGFSNQHGPGKRISERVGAIFLSRYAHGLEPTNGARALVEHLRAEGLRLVVATDAKQQELELLLKAAHVADLIAERVSGSDVEHSKPSGAIVAAALREIGLWAGDAIMIGDQPYDIQAAAREGLPTIALRCGGRTDDELTGAAAIYADPADLLAHYATSPLGRDAPPPPLDPHAMYSQGV